MVINCDLPWNPARLEQRIARAWRKHQTRPVTVFNLVTENTIEHRMLQTLALKQSVAASILDHPGEVKTIKLRSGRQAFVERLQQLVTSPSTPPKTQPTEAKTRLPADRSLAFAQIAVERINGALVRCEERYPEAGAHSVLVVVVEREPNQWREKLSSLHADLFGHGKTDPLAPVQLEIIDRATDEAIQRLVAAGLISRTTRATRPLFPVEGNAESAPLSVEEQAKAKAHRERAARKLRMGRVLFESGFTDEARPALIEAMHAFAAALAVESRLPEPASADDGIRPPLSNCWPEAVTIARSFVTETASNPKAMIDYLARV